MKNEFNKFKIDFFELVFLAETCIPPRPIARTVFWHRLINEIYYELDDNQRERMFDFITKNASFDKENKDCQLFYARFNPKNQYLVDLFHNGKAETHKMFQFEGKYYTHINRYAAPEYIKKVEKINNLTNEK